MLTSLAPRATEVGGGGAAKEGATPRLFQMLMFRSVHNKNILEWNSL